MAKLPYANRDELPSEVAKWVARIPQSATVDMIAHSPALVGPFLQQGQAIFTSLALPPRSRELVVLTVAVLAECEYEFVQHVPISESVDVDAETRDLLQRREFDSPVLSEKDRILVGFVAQVVASPAVPQQALDAVRGHFTDREVVEILRVLGFYWSLARLCTVLDLDIEVPEGLSNFQSITGHDTNN